VERCASLFARTANLRVTLLGELAERELAGVDSLFKEHISRIKKLDRCTRCVPLSRRINDLEIADKINMLP
jgi:hypothetical protein